jgi:hypothetical protein
MLDYQAEPLVSRAGDIRVHDYHDVDAGGGEVVMVAVRFVSVLLGKKVPNKSTSVLGVRVRVLPLAVGKKMLARDRQR